MKLKIYLTFGIVSSIISCTKTDFVKESEWIYINNTNKTIEITYGDGSFISNDMNFTLSPGGEHSFVIDADASRPDLSAEDYNSPYSMHGATITIDGANEVYFLGSSCDGFDGKLYSICNVKEYQYVKYGTNRFRFTYEFNDISEQY